MDIYPKEVKCPVCRNLLKQIIKKGSHTKRVIAYNCLNCNKNFFPSNENIDYKTEKVIFYIADNSGKKYKVSEIAFDKLNINENL